MTTPGIKPLVAGNWKMNGLKASLGELEAVIEGFDAALQEQADAMICPPATLVALFADKASGSAVQIGGQDCHEAVSGAHTGDIAAEMLADAGADAVIVGHSERRADHRERSAKVCEKVAAAKRAGLVAIACVGETFDERDAGETLDVVGEQIARSVPADMTANELIIAYEPVWAIGSGLTPTPENVAEVHTFIREKLVAMYGDEGAKMRILYGGSVKPGNAATLMAVANVDGGLVGGASLKASDFLGILAAYR